MRFCDIPGHEEVKRRLVEMADSGRIPHALLLEGPSGVGKFALARAFAQYVHCTDRRGGDSCGMCQNCRQHQDFNHIDTFFSFPVLKRGSGKVTVSNDYIGEFRQFLGDSPFMDFSIWLSMLDNPNGQPKIFVDEADELLRRSNVKARQSKFKIILMWLPERIGEEAANKMLKLIEEPFPDTIFVLTSDSPAEILPTIYSRVQRIGVKRYSDEEISETLIARYSIEPTDAQAIAALAEGDMNKALQSLSADKDKQKYLDLFIQLMRLAWTRKVAELRKWSVALADLGREGSARFYDYAAHLVRENFILNLKTQSLISLSRAEADFSSKFSPYINESNVVDIANVLAAARNDVKMNANGKIVAFDLAVKMILLIKRGTDQK